MIYEVEFQETCPDSDVFIRFAGTIEDSFNGMLLLQMLGCTMQLCFQCLQAFMVSHKKITDIIHEINKKKKKKKKNRYNSSLF